MKALLIVPALALVALALADPAEARRRDRYDRDHGWSDRHDRWQNRRDARRAGVVAGVVASGVARGAANSRADERYQQCMMAYGYDYDCERRLYEDRADARRTGRAVGTTAGIVTHSIVRN